MCVNMSVNHPASEDGQPFSLDKPDGIIQDDERELLERNLSSAILDDDKETFLSTIQQNGSHFKHKGQEILADVCFYDAFECAEVLLKGETYVVVEVNGRARNMFPIHYATRYCRPAIIELLLYHGARADIRCDVDLQLMDPYGRPKQFSDRTNRRPQLPLHIPLWNMSLDVSFEDLSPDYCVFKLLTLVCLPRFQNYLETVGLLAWSTNKKELIEEISQYARNGQFVHFAALFVVTHKKLSDHMEKVIDLLSSFDSNAMTNANKEVILLLLEVFMSAGDAIETYVKQEKSGVTLQQTSKDVARLLSEAGFAVKDADTNLTHCAWFRRGDHYQKEWREKSDEDSHMQHYGRSGYRWRADGKLSKPCKQSCSEKNDEVCSLEERLNQALKNDDKNEFLSTIHRGRSLFLLKGQEILEKVCEYCALDCGTALLNGETRVVVGINGRTPDKMYPIHHAAKSCLPSIVELFLYCGARADARAHVHSVYQRPRFSGIRESPKPSVRGRLPLYLTLYKLSLDNIITAWASDYRVEYSALTLLSAICLPRFQNHLETIDLLASSVKDEEIEKEFLQCARDGEVHHMAALLAVAHKRLTSPIESIPKLIFSHDSYAMVFEGKKQAMLLLLELFSRAGDAIEAYIKQAKVGVTIEQTCEEVACLLQEASFTVKRNDTDLIRHFWYQCHGHNKREWRWKAEDSGMPHYGATGFKWMQYGKGSKPCLNLGKKVVDQLNTDVKLFHSQVGGDVVTKNKPSRVVLCSNFVTPFRTRVLAKTIGNVAVEEARVGALWNVSPSNPWALLASTGGFIRRIVVK